MNRLSSTPLVVYAVGRRGLGQTVRALRMLDHMNDVGSRVSATLISGVPDADRLFCARDGVTIVSPAEVVSLADPRYGDAGESLRRQLVWSAAERVQSIVGQIAPEVFITTSHRGVAGELTPALRKLRHEGARRVLFLRDIYQPPQYEQDYASLTPRDFDCVLVAGPRSVASWLPRGLTKGPAQDVVTFGGYLGPVACSREGSNRSDREFLVICQVGGGRDGRLLVEAAMSIVDRLASFLSRSVRLRAFCGPLMSADEVAALRTGAREAVDIQTWQSSAPRLACAEVGRPDLVISMAGYNSCVEAAVSNTPAVLVPRVDPRDTEQEIRARLFSEWFNHVRSVSPGSPTKLLDAIRQLLHAPAAADALTLDRIFARSETIATAVLG